MLEFKLTDGTLVIAEINICIDEEGYEFPTLSNLAAFDGSLSKEQMIEAEEMAWILIDRMK